MFVKSRKVTWGGGCSPIKELEETFMVFQKECVNHALHGDGPWPLKSTGQHCLFLNSTCTIALVDMLQGFQK